MNLDEKNYWLVLSETPGIGPVSFSKLITVFGSARAAWLAPESKLKECGLPQRLVSLLMRRRKIVDINARLQSLEKLGVKVVCLPEKDFPKQLSQIPTCPPVLFIRGLVSSLNTPSIAIVGTRKPTSYGRRITEVFTRELTSFGFTIVSGLARGIDGIAHRTTINEGGKTIAFLGGGIDTIYPAEHVGLATQIMQNGALVSEFPPGQVPTKGNFPARNRLISGVSLGVLVVEGLSQSGTIHTALHAKKQGRPVFAVPGEVTSHQSDAPMNLLYEGKAHLVRNAHDIVAYLKSNGLIEENLIAARQTDTARIPKREFVDQIEELVYLLLELEPLESDEIIHKSELPSSQVLTALTLMELKGLIRKTGGLYSVVS